MMSSWFKRTGILVPSVAALALSASACITTARTAPIAAPNVVATATAPTTPFPVNFDPANFDENSATITNEWWPLKPGTQWIWEGQALDGEDIIRRRIAFTVTDLTKEIAGVKALVAWDRDFNNNQLAESELIFLAQDKAGNVWHFGQTAEQYGEGGQYEGVTSWIAGYLAGAKAGILMEADPKLGTPAYSEGYAPPPYFWDDFARVIKTGQKNCVRTGCYSNVVVIEEYEPTKRGASQLKYWARGVGNIRTAWSGVDAEQEVLELVKKHQLSPAAMAQARAEALKIEARSNVYGLTAPIQAPSTPAANSSR